MKVVQSEACIPQHKLVVCGFKLVDRVEKKREVFVSKCKIWKLKEKDLYLNFEVKFRLKRDVRCEGGECVEVFADEHSRRG
jgi:hypothetical protein